MLLAVQQYLPDIYSYIVSVRRMFASHNLQCNGTTQQCEECEECEECVQAISSV